MAKGKLFEYAVLYHPKEKKDAHGNIEDQKSEIVVEPRRVLAATEQEVGMLAAKAIPDTFNDKLAQIEIVIRPF